MTSLPGFQQLGTNTDDVVSDPIDLPERMIFGDTIVDTAFVRNCRECISALCIKLLDY